MGTGRKCNKKGRTMKTYEDAEKFLKEQPDYKELMQATLVAFESGYVQALTDMLEQMKVKSLSEKDIVRLLANSARRTSLLYSGNMRPDLEPECTTEAI